MSDASAREAWAAFWAGSGGSGAGCLPKATSSLDATQQALWDAAARKLPRAGKVLDLATGDGAVLTHIRRARADAKLIGVDSSPRLPPSPPGISLRAGIAMEKLPFAADSFDLVCSRFGFEYGDIEASAVEVERVLRPAGRIVFMIHHAESAVVLQNLGRAAALQWAAFDNGILRKAHALASARAAAPLATPSSFKSALADASARFSDQPVAREFAAAIFQTLELGRGREPALTLAALNALEERARHELARLAALAGAACDRARVERVAEVLGEAGLAVDAPDPMDGAGSKRFAWLLRGRKR